MRLEIGFDHEDIRARVPERVAVREAIPKKAEPPFVVQSPLDRHVQELKEQAGRSRFLEIPNRHYDRKQDVDVPTRHEERHVRSRHPLQPDISGFRLRQEENTLLAETGRFRVLSLKDAAQLIYGGDEKALRSDLRFLQEKELVTLDIVNARRDGHSSSFKRMEVITLTRSGEKLTRAKSSFSPDQRFYHGLVKPREVEHDTQIYRAYRKEWEKIEKNGGSGPRVRLDFELKSQIQKAIYVARKAEPERDLNEIKQQVAAEQKLPFLDGQIQIPDARIEYDLDQGSRTGFSDIEVVTAAYRPGHLRAKIQAGFHTYISSRDASSLSQTIEHEHHLLDPIFDL